MTRLSLLLLGLLLCGCQQPEPITEPTLIPESHECVRHEIELTHGYFVCRTVPKEDVWGRTAYEDDCTFTKKYRIQGVCAYHDSGVICGDFQINKSTSRRYGKCLERRDCTSTGCVVRECNDDCYNI